MPTFSSPAARSESGQPAFQFCINPVGNIRRIKVGGHFPALFFGKQLAVGSMGVAFACGDFESVVASAQSRMPGNSKVEVVPG